jgi:hypothetical protein
MQQREYGTGDLRECRIINLQGKQQGEDEGDARNRYRRDKEYRRLRALFFSFGIIADFEVEVCCYHKRTSRGRSMSMVNPVRTGEPRNNNIPCIEIRFFFSTWCPDLILGPPTIHSRGYWMLFTLE